MDVLQIVSLLGGVALFLFGMTLMGEGLKQVAGNKLEVVLYRLSSTPVRGILLGTFVTAVIQSSSATSVMVVGFVNAGMMKVGQAISVIMGAIVGTSVTGWIVSLSSIGVHGGILGILSTDFISAVVAIIGILFRMFSKKRFHRHIGDILMGFSILMFGMMVMSSTVSGLGNSKVFVQSVAKFSNPVLGIVIGAVFTSVIQSASAAVGILQALASTGAIGFGNAFPIIMGIGIGAAVPVLLAALGSSTDGRRAALSYLLINALGAVVVGSLFYCIDALVSFPFTVHTLRSVDVALLNTIYRLIVVVALLPLSGLIERLANILVQGSHESPDSELMEMDRLEERFLNYPALAIENVRIVMNKMAELTEKNFMDAIAMLRSGYSDRAFTEVGRIESIIDRFEDSLGTYLVKLSGHDMTTDLSKKAGIYLHTLTDFERISDHALNIAERAMEMHEKEICMTPEGSHEIDVLMNAVEAIVHMLVSAFVSDSLDDAYRVEPLEECIDDICDVMKLNHVERLASGQCTLRNGYVFNDLIVDFERISDHCSNTAAIMIGMTSGTMGIHGYTNETKTEHTHNFMENYETFKRQFRL